MTDIKCVSWQPRRKKIDGPNGQVIFIHNTIVMTVRETDVLVGVVKQGVNGVDFSDLVLLENIPKVPKGVECKVLSCDEYQEYIPVEFKFNGDIYKGVWVKSSDVIYRSGQTGMHLKGC